MNINKSQHLFSQVPTVGVNRSVFDRSHNYKTTFDEGYLVPFFVDEVLPGDTFKLRSSIFCRMTTPIYPLMDNLVLRTEFFFVPSRLVWEHWEAMYGQDNTPSTGFKTYVCPTITSPAGGFAVGSIYDYMGIPTGVADLEINALPFRAAEMVYRDYYRDENLIDAVDIPLDDGPDDPSTYALHRRAKYHDYFTSALPWPQKGPSVTLSLGGVTPITFAEGTGDYLKLTRSSSYASIKSFAEGVVGTTGANDPLTPSIDPKVSIGNSGTGTNIFPITGTNLVADLSNAGSVSINTLRQAFQLQKFYEAQARGGNRYIEVLENLFQVKSPDARLQRPEYLLGTKTRINVNTVAQTSSTDATSPQGNLSAFAVGADTFRGFEKSFVEHGYIIGFVSVQSDLTYQQGLHRMWSRSSFEDFYLPVFAHLGEQAILNKEIYAQGSSVVDEDGNVIDDQVFGYQERYAEYRYKPSLITGQFRSTYSAPLDAWHLAQHFQSLPVLGQQFIEENAPMDRVLAVPSEPDFLLDAYFNLKCTRPMPVYSVPGLVDHF